MLTDMTQTQHLQAQRVCSRYIKSRAKRRSDRWTEGCKAGATTTACLENSRNRSWHKSILGCDSYGVEEKREVIKCGVTFHMRVRKVDV